MSAASFKGFPFGFFGFFTQSGVEERVAVGRQILANSLFGSFEARQFGFVSDFKRNKRKGDL